MPVKCPHRVAPRSQYSSSSTFVPTLFKSNANGIDSEVEGSTGEGRQALASHPRSTEMLSTAQNENSNAQKVRNRKLVLDISTQETPLVRPLKWQRLLSKIRHAPRRRQSR